AFKSEVRATAHARACPKRRTVLSLSSILVSPAFFNLQSLSSFCNSPFNLKEHTCSISIPFEISNLKSAIPKSLPPVRWPLVGGRWSVLRGRCELNWNSPIPVPPIRQPSCCLVAPKPSVSPTEPLTRSIGPTQALSACSPPLDASKYCVSFRSA